MAKLALNLSKTLAPLQNELKDTMDLLCPTAKVSNDDSLFEVIEGFANKYGKSPYNSVEDILNASLAEAQYMGSPSVTFSLGDLGDLTKELTGC